MKLLSVLCILVWASVASAQESPPAEDQQKEEVVVKTPSKVTRVFKFATVTLIGSMVFDLDSTFRVMGPCVEGDPFARPFVNRGAKVAYPAALAFDGFVMWLVDRMNRSWNPAIRKIRYVIPGSLIVGHINAGFGNYRNCR
jgi:hypothetical protein